MKKKYIIIIAFTLLLAFVIIYNFQPKHIYDLYGSCYIYKEARFLCPSCGLGRCVDAILRGHFIKAFQYNPIYITIGLFVFAYYSYFYIKVYLLKQKIKNHYLIILIISIIILIAFSIIRNFIPYFSSIN